MSIVKKIFGFEFSFSLKLKPSAEAWSLESRSESPSGPVEIYKGNGYLLKMIEERLKPTTSLIRLNLKKTDGRNFVLEKLEVAGLVPAADSYRSRLPVLETREFVVRPFLETQRRRVAGHLGSPIIALCNRGGAVRLACGFLHQELETELSVSPAMMGGTSIGPEFPVDVQSLNPLPNYQSRISLMRPIEGVVLDVAEVDEILYVTTCGSYHNIMNEYLEVFESEMGYETPPLPEAVYGPVWCSWYPFYFGIDQELIYENAKIAAGLGIETILIDAGWSPQPGDWFPDLEKFPDMPGLIEKIHGLGLRVILWIAPFLIERGTRAFEKYRSLLISAEESLGVWGQKLCPRNPRVQEYVPELVAGLVRRLGLDGIKIDMIDDIPIAPCRANHKHNRSSVGPAVVECLAKIRNGIDEVLPEAIIEYRLNYANIVNRINGNAYRAFDCPWDFDQNRRLCSFLRSFAKGVAVHTDPAYWEPTESNENVAKYMMTVVTAGVPTISVDLVNAPEDHREIVRRWLRFYRENRNALTKGSFTPVQSDPQYSTIMVESGEKAFILFANYPASIVDLGPARRRIYLLNSTSRDEITVSLRNLRGSFVTTVYGPLFEEVAGPELKGKGGRVVVDLDAPQGGFAKLERK